MDAEKALKDSQDRLIVADAVRGLVIIQEQWEPGRVSRTAFQVRFVPRETRQRGDGPGIIAVGSYDNLANAVMIATDNYGVSDEAWMPATRYAAAILGEALLQGATIDAAFLSKRHREQGE